ncbi:MAG: NusG domain II-containing protein [Lutispora sp.]|nr:NusG domain II-containing protein [Lutispora sp.]
MKKGDILLLLIIFIAGMSYFGLKFLYKDTGDKTIVISVNGKEYDRIAMSNLNGEKLIHIDLEEGRHIDIKIDSQGAHVSDAICPDKICVKTGVIDKVGQSIVCLPNRVQVFIEGSAETDVDYVSQ